MNTKYFLTSPDDVKAGSYINFNVDDSDCAAAIRTAQSTYLRDIIGDKLLNAVVEMASGGTIDNPENAAYKDLLDSYITEYLTAKAMVEICVPISFKIRNMGIAQDCDTNVQSAQLRNIAEVADFFETQSIDRCNRMIKFILANRQAFPELDMQCVCGEESPNLRLRANTQLYLGF